MGATTSLTGAEFDELRVRFDATWAAQRAAKTAAGTARQRRPDGGRKGCLVSAQQKLFFILLYFKAYPTQDVMGLLFGITQGQVSEWVRQLTAVAGQLIPLYLPARQARDLPQLLAEQPELREVIIDGTERRLPRPQHRGRQSAFTADARSVTPLRMSSSWEGTRCCGVRAPNRLDVMTRKWQRKRGCDCPSLPICWATVSLRDWKSDMRAW